MSVILVGGMDRLGEKYLTEAQKFGMNLRIFSRAEPNMGRKMKHADAVVIFTNKVSHHARNEAMTAAKKRHTGFHASRLWRLHLTGMSELPEYSAQNQR